MHFLRRLIIRNHDHSAISPRPSDHDKPDSGVTSSSLNDRCAWLKQTGFLSVSDDSVSRSIFTEPAGFMNSAFPRISQPVSSDSRRSRINGVFPTYPSMPEYVALMRSESF